MTEQSVLERRPHQAVATPAASVAGQADVSIGAASLRPRGQLGTGRRLAPLLIAAYMVLMPLLVGLPRGTVVPLLRPSETLQFLITGLCLVLAVPAVMRGDSWRLHIRRSEWWLVAIVVSASVMPVLWLLVRGQSVGFDEALASFPFVKYAALYVLARATIRSSDEAKMVMYAILGTSMAVAGIAITQSLGVGPVVDFLGRYFVSSEADLVAEGRGTATIGSSIATGAYLSISCGMALSWAFSSGRRSLYTAAAILGAGALASGQAGTVLALGTVIMVVGLLHRRIRQLATVGIPIAMLASVALWPIVAARLADIDRGTGLPQSWIIRWVNLTELYWPSLWPGGWVLGVSPDASVTPPDVWREIVYLESGYLWLLWVGGIPLLASVALFLRATYRELGSPSTDPVIGGLRKAGRAAVAMVALVSVFDPHLTLRAGADLLFVLLALAAATTPFVVPSSAPHQQWRTRLGSSGSHNDGAARIALAEVDLGQQLVNGMPVESAIAVTVEHGPETHARVEVALCRDTAGLHGLLMGPVMAVDAEAGALVWRGLSIYARSLRLTSLRTHDGASTSDRRQLKWAARRSELLEIERSSGMGAASANQVASGPVTLDRLHPVPGWKRATDLVLGGAAALATAPLWAIAALLVRRSSPGPVLFRQLRIGASGRPFQMYKFRTMFLDNDDSEHREQNKLELLGLAEAVKEASDSRITAIGGTLRRTSLDELPQLINVARGEMSLVGPRPSLLWEVELFEASKRRRMEARPGLTGLWQISGRGDVSMSEMLELDLDYLADMRWQTDYRCLAATARSVVSGRGAR